MRSTILTLAMALVAGFAGAAAFSYSGLGDKQVERYLLANPDVLPRMVSALEGKQAEERLARAGEGLRQPFAGAILGNPEGKRTLIKFTDYNCGYCRASAEELRTMIAQDPELRVVIREWPIFEGSDRAARMALAAAKQGKYEAFYQEVFASGDTSESGLQAVAKKLELDLAKLEADAASTQIGFELSRNTQLAQELGFTGTPSWVAGNQVIEGAVPAEALADALDQAGA